MDIVETLRRNHEAMRRDESPYSVAADEIERLRAVIRCEQIEPPADVTDDQTTELAVQLAYAKAEIEQLRELNDTLLQVNRLMEADEHSRKAGTRRSPRGWLEGDSDD